MEPIFYDLFWQAARVFFLFVVPIVLGTSLAGILGSALQSVTSIHDPSSGYAIRLIAFLGVLYLFIPSFSANLIKITETIYKITPR